MSSISVPLKSDVNKFKLNFLDNLLLTATLNITVDYISVDGPKIYKAIQFLTGEVKAVSKINLHESSIILYPA